MLHARCLLHRTPQHVTYASVAMLAVLPNDRPCFPLSLAPGEAHVVADHRQTIPKNGYLVLDFEHCAGAKLPAHEDLPRLQVDRGGKTSWPLTRQAERRRAQRSPSVFRFAR